MRFIGEGPAVHGPVHRRGGPLRRHAAAHHRASGRVSVPGAARLIRLKRVKRVLAPGVRRKLRLKPSPRGRRAIRRALAGRQRVVARVRVTPRDRSGNSRTVRRKIRLRGQRRGVSARSRR